MNLNDILDRSEIGNQLKALLDSFRSLPINAKRNIYVYGDCGVGKTTFITNLLKEMEYDIIKYDSEHCRTSQLIESFSNLHISRTNILDNFRKHQKPMAIILDDIDTMNIGDRGCMLSLVKLVRPKKTKKQQLEPYNVTPIICIGTTMSDKSIRELYKSCNVFKIETPTRDQMCNLIRLVVHIDHTVDVSDIYNFTLSDIAKLFGLAQVYGTRYQELAKDITTMFMPQTTQYDIKTKTQVLLKSYIPLSNHSTFIHEPERTILHKLWHENVVDTFGGDVISTVSTYKDILKNICYADYLDRLTFQKQIWQLNEMSSIIKTFKTNKILHDSLLTEDKKLDIRFTKILTKYSTEYNNYIFIRNLCQYFVMDRRDLIGFIQSIVHLSDEEKVDFIGNECVTKSDIGRLTKYVNKYIYPLANDGYTDDKDGDVEYIPMELEYSI